jgi:hypothetical protein
LCVVVLGAVFNRLPTSSEAFYSLEKCKEAVTSYFAQFRRDVNVYGFLPELASIQQLADELSSAAASSSEPPSNSATAAAAVTASDLPAGALTSAERRVVNELSAAFRKHFDISLLVADLEQYHRSKQQPGLLRGANQTAGRFLKRQHPRTQSEKGAQQDIKRAKTAASPRSLSRESIQQAARSQGAAGG